MKSNYTIALLDILGFGELIEQNPLATVVDKPLSWFRKSLGHSIRQAGYPNDVPSLEHLLNQSKLGLAWFSDTLLLYTLQDTDEHLKDLMVTLGWFLFETMFLPRTRIRGAVAYGEAHIDAKNSIFLGKPIIEAHRLEKIQAWSGCSLTESASRRIPEGVRYDPDQLFFYWLTQYPVPLNGAEPQEMLVVDWTLGVHDRFDFPWASSSAEPSTEDWETKRAICEKWKNTRQFHRDVCRDCHINAKP